MSRYIDADHAEFRLQSCGTYHGVIAFDTVKAVLNDAPSIDIVRCKECEWRDNIGCALKIVDDSDKPKDDDYCSFGERKEGE